MLRSLKEIEKYDVSATDGELGTVVDFLFDDERWAVRYLVVETGTFLNGRQVLISPVFFRPVDWGMRRFHLAMTRDKVKRSPSIDLHEPVSRQHEQEYYGYYGYPYYWGYTGLWGTAGSPGLLAPTRSSVRVPGKASTPAGDSHLRSAREVIGYTLHGSDDSLGHVADLIVEDETWAVRYLVLDTSHWWWGKKVLLSPAWASEIRWADKTVAVNVSREKIKQSPGWDGIATINRHYEGQLYRYYGRRAYWGDGAPDDATMNTPSWPPLT